MKILLPLIVILTLVNANGDSAENIMTFKDFIFKSTKSNPGFQLLLIDELYLKYRDYKELPVSDIILSVTGEYGAFINSDTFPENDFEGGITLEKLFPVTGTSMSIDYSKTSNFSRNVSRFESSLGFEIGQSIVKNAFGKSTRLLKKKIETGTRLVRHQIVEAYEDYLSTLMLKYILWHESFEHLKVVKENYREYSELHRSIMRKRRFRVARPEDVDKSRLELLNAQESMITLQKDFDRLRDEIAMLANIPDAENMVPENPGIKYDDRSYGKHKLSEIIKSTRSVKMLSLLEKEGILAREIAEDNLLPSTGLFLGYNVLGEKYRLRNPEHKIYGGITAELNFGRQNEKADLDIKKIDIRKSVLKKKNDLLNLTVNLKQLHMELQRERILREIAGEKLIVSQRIYRAERKKYFIGRTSLNDLFLAKRSVNDSKRNRIVHDKIFSQLVVEWKRLSDDLLRKIPFNK